mgnify:CR=1 FL=1
MKVTIDTVEPALAYVEDYPLWRFGLSRRRTFLRHAKYNDTDRWSSVDGPVASGYASQLELRLEIAYLLAKRAEGGDER